MGREWDGVWEFFVWFGVGKSGGVLIAVACGDCGYGLMAWLGVAWLAWKKYFWRTAVRRSCWEFESFTIGEGFRTLFGFSIVVDDMILTFFMERAVIATCEGS